MYDDILIVPDMLQTDRVLISECITITFSIWRPFVIDLPYHIKHGKTSCMLHDDVDNNLQTTTKIYIQLHDLFTQRMQRSISDPFAINHASKEQEFGSKYCDILLIEFAQLFYHYVAKILVFDGYMKFNSDLRIKSLCSK